MEREREKRWQSEQETDREKGGAVFMSAQCVKYSVYVHMLWDIVVSQASQVCTAVINFKTCLHFKKPQRTDLLMYSFLWKWSNAILVDPSTFPCNQGPQIPSVCIWRVSPRLRGPHCRQVLESGPWGGLLCSLCFSYSVSLNDRWQLPYLWLTHPFPGWRSVLQRP